METTEFGGSDGAVVKTLRFKPLGCGLESGSQLNSTAGVEPTSNRVRHQSEL